MPISIEAQMQQEKASVNPDRPRAKLSLKIRAERALLLLLYHPECDWLHRLKDGSCVIRAGRLAVALKWKSYEVYHHLDHLKANGYLETYDRTIGKGLTLIRLRPPHRMQYDV